MIKINKQLQRKDKGAVSTGSIIDFTTFFISEKLIIRYNLTHWFSQAAKDESTWLPISGITEFDYTIIKECTVEEWTLLDEAGSAELVQNWLKEIIDSKIGTGKTEIV